MRTKLFAAAAAVLTVSAHASEPSNAMGLSGLAKLAEVDERFQAYNVEMIEFTGGLSGPLMAVRRMNAIASGHPTITKPQSGRKLPVRLGAVVVSDSKPWRCRLLALPTMTLTPSNARDVNLLLKSACAPAII